MNASNNAAACPAANGERQFAVRPTRTVPVVHATDVARATGILLTAPNVAGEAFNCYDRNVSEHEVATLAWQLCGSRSVIHGVAPQPKNQIVTDKLRTLGMDFGGQALPEQTVRELIAAV